MYFTLFSCISCCYISVFQFVSIIFNKFLFNHRSLTQIGQLTLVYTFHISSSAHLTLLQRFQSYIVFSLTDRMRLIRLHSKGGALVVKRKHCNLGHFLANCIFPSHPCIHIYPHISPVIYSHVCISFENTGLTVFQNLRLSVRSCAGRNLITIGTLTLETLQIIINFGRLSNQYFQMRYKQLHL